MTDYTYRVQWSKEDGEYVGLCAEFPSLSWLAPTEAEARVGIARLVADVVAEDDTHRSAATNFSSWHQVVEKPRRCRFWRYRRRVLPPSPGHPISTRGASTNRRRSLVGHQPNWGSLGHVTPLARVALQGDRR